MRTLLSALGLCGLFLGCGSTAKNVPTLRINSPTDNSTVNVSSSKMIAVNFSTDYTLKAPGGCGALDACGQIYALIDSSTCNQTNLPYNALAVSSPVQVDLQKCPTAQGMHTITLELHHDAGEVVTDLIGNPVTSKVTITAQVQ